MAKKVKIGEGSRRQEEGVRDKKIQGKKDKIDEEGKREKYKKRRKRKRLNCRKGIR